MKRPSQPSTKRSGEFKFLKKKPPFPGTFMGKTGFPIIKWEFEYFISYIICLIKNPAFMLCKVNIYTNIYMDPSWVHVCLLANSKGRFGLGGSGKLANSIHVSYD